MSTPSEPRAVQTQYQELDKKLNHEWHLLVRAHRKASLNRPIWLFCLAWGVEAAIAFMYWWGAFEISYTDRHLWVTSTIGTAIVGLVLTVLMAFAIASSRIDRLLSQLSRDRAVGVLIGAALVGAGATWLYVVDSEPMSWSWLWKAPAAGAVLGFVAAIILGALYYGSMKVAELAGWTPPEQRDEDAMLQAAFQRRFKDELAELRRLESVWNTASDESL